MFTKNVERNIHLEGNDIKEAYVNCDKVILKDKKEVFEAGSTRDATNISGGKFSQANIGGQGTWHNDGTNIGAAAGGETASSGGRPKIAPWDPKDDMDAPVLRILQKGLSAEKLLQLLQNGLKLATIEKGLEASKCRNEKMVAIIADSMLKTAAAQ